MEKMPIEEFLHSMDEGLQKIYSQLDLLVSSPNLTEKDVRIINQAQEDARALIMIAATPLEKMKRNEMRLQHPIVTYFEMSGEKAECAIKDVGPGGSLVMLDRDVDEGDEISVNFPEIGMIDCTVTGNSPTGTHLAFNNLPPAKSSEIMSAVFNNEHL